MLLVQIGIWTLICFCATGAFKLVVDVDGLDTPRLMANALRGIALLVLAFFIWAVGYTYNFL